MNRVKLRKARPKALFGEAAATLTAAGIQATATVAAAATQAKASRDAAKTQASNIKSAAEKQAEAIKAQSDSDKENTEKSLDLMREQHDEEVAMQKDIQMDIQRAMGQQNENARLEQGKIQVRNGGSANSKIRLQTSPLWGGSNVVEIEGEGNQNRPIKDSEKVLMPYGTPFKVTDGGSVIPEGITPYGNVLYSIIGNDHEHYHKTKSGKYKTGVGFKFPKGADVKFLSAHNIEGFNPVKSVNAGMDPTYAFILQEQIKKANGISDDGKGNYNPPVKKNGGMIYTRGTSNVLQPYYLSDLNRRTLKCGGRTKAGIGDYIRNGLDWLLRNNQLAQYVNNSAYGKFVDNAWNSYNDWANGLVNDIKDAISTAHVSPSFGWYGLGSTPTKEERNAASKAMKNYYTDLIKETKQDIKSGQLLRDLRNTNQLFSDIYGATGINLGGEYGPLGSATPGGSTAIAGAILRGGKPLANRAVEEVARKAQQNFAINTAQARIAEGKAFDKYLNNSQATLDMLAANKQAKTFTPTIDVNGNKTIPSASQFTDDLGLNAFGASYPANSYGARMMQIENGIKSQMAAMPTTKQLIGYMRTGAAQRAMMPRSLKTAGQKIGNALDNAYWWGRYLPARTIENVRNIRAARSAKASLNDPALNDWANGIMSSWRPAGQQAATQAAGQVAQNTAKINWIKQHPYWASSLGIVGLGIGGSLLYNAANPNGNIPSGPVSSAAMDSAAVRQQAQAQPISRQRNITSPVNNDTTNASRDTVANTASNRVTNTVNNAPVSTSNDTASVSKKVAQQTSNASSQKSSKQVSTSQAVSDAKANNETVTFKNFNEAFDYYHEKYGDNGTFTFGGLKYGTKKETDKKKEARNRRWGARRTEESLAKILGDISNKSDNDVWNIYLNRKDRRQTKFGGSLRPKAKNGTGVNGWYDIAGAGINSLGSLGGALLATHGNNAAAKYLSRAYGQAGNILADAYRSMTGIDADYLKQADFKSAHMMPALQAVTSNAAAPLAQEERTRLRTLRNAGRYSASGAAAINRMNNAETDSRDSRARIYATDSEYQDKIRERNAQSLNQSAQFNAQSDNEANKNELGYKMDMIKYNNDIANTSRLGAAQSEADALTQSSSAVATAKQSNANAWMSTLSSTGTSFANALSTIGKRIGDYNNIIAGTDIGAQVGAVVSNNDSKKAASLYQKLDFSKPIDRDYGMQLERQFPNLKGTNATGIALEWQSKQNTPTSVATQLTPQNSLATTPAYSAPVDNYNIRYPRGINVFYNY